MAAPVELCKATMRKSIATFSKQPAPPAKRRGPCLAGFGAVLLLAAALGGCTGSTLANPSASGLALDFSWPQPPAPTFAQSLNPPPPPHHVTVTWNPRRYSHDEIAQIANQQCLTFGREAKPASGVSGGALKTQRFHCVMTAASGGALKG